MGFQAFSLFFLLWNRWRIVRGVRYDLFLFWFTPQSSFSKLITLSYQLTRSYTWIYKGGLSTYIEQCNIPSVAYYLALDIQNIGPPEISLFMTSTRYTFTGWNIYLKF
ncbi:hypothetical protein F4775DRAFT_570200 [Biscogniauxia sp. FL1348]|nr:hypothetical protein F4775DRAFT_570200 [Biscogniauxia sp. FL1348]